MSKYGNKGLIIVLKLLNIKFNVSDDNLKYFEFNSKN